ncbi:hypothetical protein COE78_27895, partial [Bacillus pseudomycoides]
MMIIIKGFHHITIKIRKASIPKQKNVHFHLEMYIFSFWVCYKILKLMDVWRYPMPIKLKRN